MSITSKPISDGTTERPAIPRWPLSQVSGCRSDAMRACISEFHDGSLSDERVRELTDIFLKGWRPIHLRSPRCRPHWTLCSRAGWPYADHQYGQRSVAKDSPDAIFFEGDDSGNGTSLQAAGADFPQSVLSGLASASTKSYMSRSLPGRHRRSKAARFQGGMDQSDRRKAGTLDAAAGLRVYPISPACQASLTSVEDPPCSMRPSSTLRSFQRRLLRHAIPMSETPPEAGHIMSAPPNPCLAATRELSSSMIRTSRFRGRQRRDAD